MIIYANLLLLLQAEAVRAAVYILNLTPSDALGGNFLRHVIDTALGRSINAKKPLLNTLRAYGSTTVVYDEAVLRGAKIDARGERGQLVRYKDSIYRVQIPSKHKVKRTLYCQFVEEGELTEILGIELEVTEEINQQFEPNIIEPRDKVLDMPDNYTIETVNPDTIDERNKHFTDEPNDPIAQDDVLDAVDSSTKEGGLL